MKDYVYSVSGNRWFPLDMLRYDSCYPVSSGDVFAIAESLQDNTSPGREYTVKLRSNKEPTAERWASFQWKLGKVII